MRTARDAMRCKISCSESARLNGAKKQTPLMDRVYLCRASVISRGIDGCASALSSYTSNAFCGSRESSHSNVSSSNDNYRGVESLQILLLGAGLDESIERKFAVGSVWKIYAVDFKEVLEQRGVVNDSYSCSHKIAADLRRVEELEEKMGLAGFDFNGNVHKSFSSLSL